MCACVVLCFHTCMSHQEVLQQTLACCWKLPCEASANQILPISRSADANASSLCTLIACSMSLCCPRGIQAALGSSRVEGAMQGDQASSRCSQLADESMHPHTKWMLRQLLAKYVLDPRPVSLKHPKPTTSGGLAAASGSPSGPSNDASGQGATLEADTATQHEPSPEAAQTSGLRHSSSAAAMDQAQSQMPHSVVQDLQQGIDQGQGPYEQATPALSGFSASHPANTAAGSELYTPAGEQILSHA